MSTSFSHIDCAMRMLRGVYLVVYNINIANNINYATNISYFISRELSTKNCRQFTSGVPGLKGRGTTGPSRGGKGVQEEQGYRGNRMQEVQEEQGRKQGIRRTDPRSPGNRGRFVRRDKPAQGRRENRDRLSWFPREGRSRLIRRNRPRGSAGKSSEILAIRN